MTARKDGRLLRRYEMREILFRGKRIDNGAWETGGITAYEQTIRKSGYEIIGKADGFHIPVIPETVGQYTGVKDKNGDMIFEGDIVAEISDMGEIGDPGKVYWHREHGSFYWGMGNSLVHSRELRIIGNVHDNPPYIRLDHEPSNA